LADQGNGNYAGLYTGFAETGPYRLVIRAEDDDGLEARPVAIAVSTASSSLYLPSIRR
jgi:hypothetical protein